MEKQKSKTNLSNSGHNSRSQLVRKTPSRNNFASSNTSVEVGSPSSSPSQQSTFKMLLQLLKMIVKKLQELQTTLNCSSVVQPKKKTQGGGFISIREKEMTITQKSVEPIQSSKIQIMLERLQSTSPIRAAKQLTLNVSPARMAYEQMELKMLLVDQVQPLKDQMKDLRGKLQSMQKQYTELFSNYEEELIGLITSLKDFVFTPSKTKK